MKKQLLILVLVLFGISLTYGQTVTCPVPRNVDVTCLPNDAIHPIAGNPYDYIVTVPTPPGTHTYNWFVTDDPAFLAGGVLTTDIDGAPGTYLAATGAGYNNTTTGTNTISLTWNSFVYDPANPVFVVIQVTSTSTDPGLCVTNNLKVFRIEPVNAFTLDIANVDLTGTAANYETPIDRCISDVVSAAYNSATGGVLYDFGVDYLYYVVTAANFSTSWRPSLRVTAIDPLETVTAVEWARNDDFTFTTPHAMPFDATANAYVATDVVTALATNGTVGQAGECILIRVTIDHTGTNGNYQGLANETVTVAVDGFTQLALTTPLGDVHWSSTLPSNNTFCGLEDGFQFDLATQIIRPRPDIQSATPAVPGPGNEPFLTVEP